MPRHHIAAYCNTANGESYNLCEFPSDALLCAKLVQVVKCYQSNWDGPTATSMLCYKHFDKIAS